MTFAEKKEVEKIKLGKIGIATQYKPLTDDKAQNEKWAVSMEYRKMFFEFCGYKIFTSCFYWYNKEIIDVV